MDRRTFLGTTTAIGTTILAGCGGTTDGGSGGGSGGSDDGGGGGGGGGGTTGTFRLLISDRPADIGDFDSLDVTFDEARVFEAAATDTESTATATNTTAASETPTGTETAEPTDEEEDADGDADADEDDGDEGEGGFTVFDLDDPTVDLTEVVGEKAIGVLDGKLEPGRYAKVELSVSEVDGVVDGESVEVKVPSEKLQIVKPFEVVAGETTSFVFDINVVKKGPNGYNLLPVISESGVAGQDVDVEEVGDEEGEDDSEADEADSDDGSDAETTETAEPTETDGENRGNQSQT